MTSQLEFNSRAALCREFARREPNSRALWMAEAESWSRLEQEPGEPVATHRDKPICHRGNLHDRNWFCFKFKATGKHSQSRQVAGIVRKDPFEEFLDLMAIEDGR